MKNELLIKAKDLLYSKSPNSKLISLIIRGSHAYGTNDENSDIDLSGVYIQSYEDILSNNYIPYISDEKNDITLFEVQRYLELLSKSNPNMIELLFADEENIIFKDQIYDLILVHKNEFISQEIVKTFTNYAYSQIAKAKGLDKKANYKKDKITRKDPLDFCYFHLKEKSIPLKIYLKEKNIDNFFCGVSKIPHNDSLYSLFYDYNSHSYFSKKISHPVRLFNIFLTKIENLTMLKGFKLIKDKDVFGFKGATMEDSNDIRLSSISKNVPEHFFLGHMSYNKDGYSEHCKEYNSYIEWDKNKNESRYVDVKNHGQTYRETSIIDGKNLLHCVRLLEMSKEILEGKGVNIKRENAEYLLSIKKGKVNLEDLIEKSDRMINEMKNSKKSFIIKESIDKNIQNRILLNVRKQFYNLK